MTVVALIVLAGRAALPGLDVLRLPRHRLAGRAAGERSAPRSTRPTCARSTRACSAARGPAACCSAPTSCSASATRVLVLVQATLLARIVARAFDGASLARRRARARRCSLLRLRGARRCSLGASRSPGGARPRRVLSELRLALAEQRLRDAAGRARRRRGRGGRGRERRRASTRSRRTSAATCRRSCWRASSRSPCSRWVAAIDLHVGARHAR